MAALERLRSGLLSRDKRGKKKVNKQSLWQHLTNKNPHWLNQNVTLTPAGLKKLHDTIYDQAHKEGMRAMSPTLTEEDRQLHKMFNKFPWLKKIK